MLQVFERQPVAESSQQKENIETVEFVENLPSESSYQLLDREKCKSRPPYSLFRLQNRNMGLRDGPSKERFRKDRCGSWHSHIGKDDHSKC